MFDKKKIIISPLPNTGPSNLSSLRNIKFTKKCHSFSTAFVHHFACAIYLPSFSISANFA